MLFVRRLRLLRRSLYVVSMASVPGRWQQCLDCHGGHLQDVVLKTWGFLWIQDTDLTWPCSVVFIAVHNKCVILLSKWVTLNAAPCTRLRKTNLKSKFVYAGEPLCSASKKTIFFFWGGGEKIDYVWLILVQSGRKSGPYQRKVHQCAFY